MNLRFIERDGKKVLQQHIPDRVPSLYVGGEWQDVPVVEEKKESKKLWEILRHEFYGSKEDTSEKAFSSCAKAAIDAVIECYKEWEVTPHVLGQRPKSFSEYLKENLL